MQPKAFFSPWLFGWSVWILAMLNMGGDTLELRWRLAPGEVSFLDNDNAHRGAALNPVTGNVLVVSRTGQPDIHVLSGMDGSVLYTLDNDPSTLAGGTFLLNMVGVAEDGVVYAGNLSTSAANPQYRLYRWSDDGFNAYPDLAYEGDPGGSDPEADNAQRWGDTMDVRGSGTNTEILLASRAGNQVAILTTTDGEIFESQPIVIPRLTAGALGLGVAFGQGNTLYGSTVNGSVYWVHYDLQAGTGEVVATYPGALISAGIAPLGVDPSNHWMGGLNVQSHEISLFDLSDSPNAPTWQATEALGTTQANGNGTGSVDFASKAMLVLDTNNGLAVWDVLESDELMPPTITVQPFDQAILETASVALTVAVTGTPPFTYQWFKDDQLLVGANESTFRIESASSQDAGTYRVEISNEVGQTSSEDVLFEVHPIQGSSRVRTLWALEPGSVSFLTTDNTQRGMTFNRATGHVLVASRSRGHHIFVLDAATGKTLHEMDTDTSILTAGLFKLNMIAASDDGAVFGGNLTLNGSDPNQPYTLYVWSNDGEDAFPEMAYQGDPSDGVAERWGDSIDARGSGQHRQVLISSRSGLRVVLFTTEDGVSFEPHVFEGTQGGIGLAFGEGDTFWTKAPAGPLNHYAFDLDNGTVDLIEQVQLPGSLVPIGVSVELGLLAGIDLSTPDHVTFYDLSEVDSVWSPISEVLFPTDNANGNQVGAVSFGPKTVYALNTNNGLMALEWNTVAEVQPATFDAILAQGGAVTMSFTGSPDSVYTLERTLDFRDWQELSTLQTDSSGAGVATDDWVSDPSRKPSSFYRLVGPQ